MKIYLKITFIPTHLLLLFYVFSPNIFEFSETMDN